MFELKQSLAAWGSDNFRTAFKAEVEQLEKSQLPLQQGLSLSSYVSGDPIKVMVINEAAEGDTLRVKAGIFYTGIIAGCSCSDDPTPQDVQSEYCDLQFDIDTSSAETKVKLLED